MSRRQRAPRSTSPSPRTPARQPARQPARAPRSNSARQGQVQTQGTRTPTPTKPGTRDGGGFTGPTSDMGPTVHVPDHLMPFEPTTMFA